MGYISKSVIRFLMVHIPMYRRVYHSSLNTFLVEPLLVFISKKIATIMNNFFHVVQVSIGDALIDLCC